MPFEITRTELVWPGKYDEDGKRREPPRVSLPFQVIERVNESRATREAEKRRDLTLFDVWKGDEGETFEEGWRNKLIWGDNLLVMSSLLDQFAGKVDLIYIDPPFATGSDFSLTLPVGEGGDTLYKEQTTVEEKAYRDTWGRGRDSYLAMLNDRLVRCRELLSSSGTIYVHLDYRMDSYVRVLMDEVFGQTALRNSIAWCYTGPSRVTKDYPDKHDTIYRYSPGDSPYFDPESPEVRLSYAKSLKAASKPTGIYATREEELDYLGYDEKGKLVEDWWADVTPVGRIPTEDVKFPTQKPEKLLRRIIDSSCPPGGLVVDVFAGSGTSLVAAEQLGRRWIGCDLGRFAIHTARKRLLELSDCRPFEVLNLGRYERQYWQIAAFGADLDEDGSIAVYEYIAFILKLYGATAVSGMGSLHGKLGKAFVHVGAVDSPVTIQEIADAIDECKAVEGTELHVLGWEWEMGVNDLMVEQAKKEGVKLVLRQIPREVMEAQAAAKGDVRFFELAYLDFEVKPTRREREFQVILKDFAIPNPELVPDEVRSKIEKWSDYVDYWAVDWDFRDDTFMQGWVDYRTRKKRALALKSDPHAYDEPGEYTVMVKVVDIFGNDTSKIARVQVK